MAVEIDSFQAFGHFRSLGLDTPPSTGRQITARTRLFSIQCKAWYTFDTQCLAPEQQPTIVMKTNVSGHCQKTDPIDFQVCFTISIQKGE